GAMAAGDSPARRASRRITAPAHSTSTAARPRCTNTQGKKLALRSGPPGITVVATLKNGLIAASTLKKPNGGRRWWMNIMLITKGMNPYRNSIVAYDKRMMAYARFMKVE